MNKTRRLVTSALFAAFTCIATMLSIGPIPPVNGYIHPGDALVLMCGFTLGPLYGAIAAAIGSALADIILGYAVYAPATFIIKFLVALLAGLLYTNNKSSVVKVLLISVLSEFVMIAGYYIYEAYILAGGIGPVAALYGIPANAVQAVFAVIVATVTLKFFKKQIVTEKISK